MDGELCELSVSVSKHASWKPSRGERSISLVASRVVAHGYLVYCLCACGGKGGKVHDSRKCVLELL